MPDPDSGTQNLVVNPLGYPAAASKSFAFWGSNGYGLIDGSVPKLFGSIGPGVTAAAPRRIWLTMASLLTA
jgi:hypothetical protein